MLTEAARGHSEDMALKDCYSHDSPDGEHISSPAQRSWPRSDIWVIALWYPLTNIDPTTTAEIANRMFRWMHDFAEPGWRRMSFGASLEPEGKTLYVTVILVD